MNTTKKAVIQTGGKQYLVSEGLILEVELLPKGKTIDFDPLLIIDGEKTHIGKPLIDNAKVSAEVIQEKIAGEKVIAIRYKAKKRVKKVRGHRQNHAQIKITKIT